MLSFRQLLLNNGSASRAYLGRVRWIYIYYFTTSFYRFAMEHLSKCCPTRVQYASIQRSPVIIQQLRRSNILHTNMRILAHEFLTLEYIKSQGWRSRIHPKVWKPWVFCSYQDKPELKDAICYIQGKKIVKTGTHVSGCSSYDYYSGCDDYDPPYLRDEHTHVILNARVIDSVGSKVPYCHEIEIEKMWVQKVDKENIPWHRHDEDLIATN